MARKALAFGLGSLPRLVLRPAIERRVPEVFRRALLLARDRISRITAAIIGVDRFGEGLIVVTNNMREFGRMPGIRAENWA